MHSPLQRDVRPICLAGRLRDLLKNPSRHVELLERLVTYTGERHGRTMDNQPMHRLLFQPIIRIRPRRCPRKNYRVKTTSGCEELIISPGWQRQARRSVSGKHSGEKATAMGTEACFAKASF